MGACPSCGTQLAGAPKFCPECGTPLDAPVVAPREARKLVTVLFSDVTGSTALGEHLDAEAVRGLMGRYFAAMKLVIERHGGTVEKFIGDAVMAVFGIPAVHEDDALRAVRAAMQMREALAALNTELATERGVTIQTRTGITTGEVVAGDPAAGQTLVTGDTVNTAARLEQAATPGEILIGEPTWRLVRDAVTAEAVEEIAAKGKALPVPAYRLTSVLLGAEGHQRHFDAPLIGRERELARIQQAYRDAVEQRSPQLFTLLGAAGVGKSRLIREFLGALEEAARVIRGRCLPYGEGITYWPLAEALREAAGIVDSDDRAAAGRKLLTLLDGERDAELIAARLATAIGLSDEPAAQADLFWAARRTLEHMASTQPLVVVFDDIHWAEPTFLDLIDHLADWSHDAPIFLLAPARPELLDARAGWAGGKLNATTILLETLPVDATGRLIDALPGGSALPEALRERIAAAAEGNPLFVEELMAMLVDDGVVRLVNGEWTAVGDLDALAIPPTIQALLAARLDRLSADERHVAERASVVGRVFEPEAVAALSARAPSAGTLTDQLMALVRKELVRPDRSEVTGGDAFKFRHILIRDAAYTSLPKRERADLHERFANWLEQVAGDRAPEFAEIIGHHLEQAVVYQRELGTASQPDLGRRATDWLRSAALRAWDRWDYPGAASLFAHAAGQAPSIEERLELRERAAWALRRAGRYREALVAAEAIVRDAEEEGQEAAALRATVLAADLAIFRTTSAVPELANALPGLVDRLRQLGDVRGLALASYAESSLHMIAVRFDRAFTSLTQALEHAAASDTLWIEQFCNGDLVWAAELGSTPIATLREYVARSYVLQPSHWPPGLRATTDAELAILEADLDQALRAMEDATKLLRERDSGDTVSATAIWGPLLLYAGHVEQAADFATACMSPLADIGNENLRVTMAGAAGEALALLGRADEALPLIADAATADASDVITHVMADRARAWVALNSGALAEADECANRAMRGLDGTEAPMDLAQTLVVESAVAAARGDLGAARRSLDRARELMVAKGAHAVVRAIDERRAALPTH